MNQKGEQKMGTESIPKLMVSMAVPSIIAQIINILYNIVDRIYIGHIPRCGCGGAYRGRHHFSHHYPDFRIFSLRGNGRSAACGDLAGKRGQEACGKNTRQRNLSACYFHRASHGCFLWFSPAVPIYVRRIGCHHRLCNGLHVHISAGNPVCGAGPRAESLYYFPGPLPARHDIHRDRSGGKYSPGSSVYFCIWLGSEGRGHSNCAFPGGKRGLERKIPYEP